MEKEELKILEELRRILNSKNEAIVILNNYFKGGVGKSKLSTMFAYLTDKFNLKIKPKSDYPLKTLYPRAFQTGQNHLIYYDFTTVE